MPIPIRYGRNLLPEALPEGREWIVVTTPPVAKLVEDRLQGLSAHLLLAPAMDESLLQAWESALPAADAVLGVGGGICMDVAKHVAWQRGLPLWLAPSALSVDACLTESIAVRRQGKVCYVGEAYPQELLVDFPLLQSAPPHLNRAGAGDILSIHTSLWDWDLAARETGETYDASIAAESAGLLVRLQEASEEIRAVTELGLRELTELFAAEVELCRRAGSSRPEEGSEHFWAYNVEYLYPRPYIHGQLVTLGVLLMAALQQNALEQVYELTNRLGIHWRPHQVGLSQKAIVEALATAREYAVADGLPFSVLQARPLALEQAQQVWERVTTLE